MLRLLNIEFQKLRYSRSAKILVIIYLILFTLIALFATINFNFGAAHFQAADLGIFNFPYIWHFNTWVASLLKIFLAIVIVSMMSNEYSNRTLKQNLIDGLSKKEFVLSKFYTVIVFSVISTLLIFIVSLVLGLIFSDYTEASIVFSDMSFLIGYLFKLIGFFTFCMFLGVLVKRSAFALGFLVVWWIVESLAKLALHFMLLSTSGKSSSVSQFFPLESMSNLIKQPFSRLNVIQNAANQLHAKIDMDYAVHWYQLLIVIVWTVIFVYGSYALIKRRDL